MQAPGGWQLIGRTPVATFDPSREIPFLFRPGDLVEFYAISELEYLQIEQDENFKPLISHE